MIILDLETASGGNVDTIHSLISESIATYPDIIVDPVWREYSNGDMKDQIGSVRRAALGLRNPTSPMQNMIRMCIRQIVGRIRFKRFVVDDERTQAWLDEYAVKNSIARKAVSIVRRQLTDGNAALSQVWRGGSDGMAYVRNEYWMDTHGSGIFVGVDDSNNPTWAVAQHQDNDNEWHRVIYLPGSILRFRGGDPLSDSWNTVGEDDWTDLEGNPIGMPISHFSNADPDFGPYGSSTVREIIPVQDSLNLSLFNRMAVSATTGQQVMWGTGVKAPEPGSVGPGTFLSTESPDGRYGHIPPGSIDGLLQETDDLRNIISGAFPVPSYRIGNGDWPSGLAIQRADGPMLASCRLLRDVQAGGLIHHAHRATIMNNVFGTGGMDTEALITIEWEPLDDIDPGTEAEIQQVRSEALALAEGLSEVSMRKTGMFTNEEIKAILAERKDAAEELIGQGPESDF